MAEKLILHHTYDRGIAFDVSEYANHGELLGGVGPAGGPYVGTMQFFTGDSWIRVRPSETFTDMRSVRVQVRFLASPLAGPSHRHNLVEGHASFALFVNPDGSLQGTILDATGNWDGPITPPGTMSPDVTHVVEYHHDGISRARLWVDGTLRAERFDVPGPVRNVQPDGVAIGHWPHPDNRYSLEGYVDDVKIWVYDPKPDVRQLLDECCLDRAELDRLLGKARSGGWDGQAAGDLVREVLDLATEITNRTRGGDPATIAALSQLTRDGMLAFKLSDLTAFSNVIAQVHALMRARMTDAELLAYGQQALDQLARSPFGPQLFNGNRFDFDVARKLAAMLCLEGLVPDDPRKPDRPQRPPRRPDGDTDTDGPDGKPPDDWDTGVNKPPPDRPGEGKPERPADDDSNGENGEGEPERPADDDERDEALPGVGDGDVKPPRRKRSARPAKTSSKPRRAKKDGGD